MSRPRLSLARSPRKPSLVGTMARAMRWMPAAIDRVHLQWALREIDPLHPDVAYIVRRLSLLENRI